MEAMACDRCVCEEGELGLKRGHQGMHGVKLLGLMNGRLCRAEARAAPCSPGYQTCTAPAWEQRLLLAGHCHWAPAQCKSSTFRKQRSFTYGLQLTACLARVWTARGLLKADWRLYLKEERQGSRAGRLEEGLYLPRVQPAKHSS